MSASGDRDAAISAVAEVLFSDSAGGSSGLDDMLAATCTRDATLAVDALIEAGWQHVPKGGVVMVPVDESEDVW